MANEQIILSNGDELDLSAHPAQFVKIVSAKQLAKLVKNCEDATVYVPSLGHVKIVKADFLAMLAGDDYDDDDLFVALFDGLSLEIHGHIAATDA